MIESESNYGISYSICFNCSIYNSKYKVGQIKGTPYIYVGCSFNNKLKFIEQR